VNLATKLGVLKSKRTIVIDQSKLARSLIGWQYVQKRIDSFPVPQVNTLTRACVDNIGFVQSQSLLWQLAAERTIFF
jgi:hypothetical protein